MRCYPVRQRLKALQAQGISTSDFGGLDGEIDAYRALLSLTGAIVRKGNREQKALLISTLRDTAFVDSLANLRHISATTKGVTNAEIAPYSMALKEDGDKSSVAPVYHTQTLSLDPPLLKATVTFKGLTFEGRGRTKKQARHFAAKEACEYLEIKIS